MSFDWTTNDWDMSQSTFSSTPTNETLSALNQSESNSTDLSFIHKPITLGQSALMFGMFVVVAITFGSNLFVLVSFIFEKKLRTTFSALIANLALADTLVAITAMDFYTINVVYGYWPFGKILCGIWVVFDYNLVFVSSWSLAAIAFDRMWSIKWSIHYRQHNNMRKATGFVIAIWLVILC